MTATTGSSANWIQGQGRGRARAQGHRQGRRPDGGGLRGAQQHGPPAGVPPGHASREMGGEGLGRGGRGVHPRTEATDRAADSPTGVARHSPTLSSAQRAADLSDHLLTRHTMDQAAGHSTGVWTRMRQSTSWNGSAGKKRSRKRPCSQEEPTKGQCTPGMAYTQVGDAIHRAGGCVRGADQEAPHLIKGGGGGGPPGGGGGGGAAPPRAGERSGEGAAPRERLSPLSGQARPIFAAPASQARKFALWGSDSSCRSIG